MSHYFDAQPDAGHLYQTIPIHLAGHDFTFKTDQAVFSRSRLDYGSALLIEAVTGENLPRSGRLLDLGCGYGAIGIIMKRLYPALEVVLCDINARAVGLARENALLNQARFLEIVQSDALQSVAGSFDLILTNPPIRAGKATVRRFFAESADRLNPDGRLYIVIQKKQGAPSALAYLQQLFPSVTVIDRSGGYWIIRADMAGPAVL